MNILNINELKQDILKFKKVDYFLKKEDKLSLHSNSSLTQNNNDQKRASKRTYMIYAVVLMMMLTIIMSIITSNVFDRHLMASFAIIIGAYAIQQLNKSKK